MNGVFNRLRWRLAGWSVLVVGAIVLLLGIAVYASLSRSLEDAVDRGLEANSQAASNTAHEFFESGRLDSAGYQGGLFFLIADPHGDVLANPQAIRLADLPDGVLTGPTPRFETFTLNGDPVRIYAHQVDDVLAPNDILVVGQSLSSEREAVSRLLVLLLFGGGFGIVLAIVGAWFLAGRALIPIEAAMQRQQEFVADASHELRTPLTILHSATDLLDQHMHEPLLDNRSLLTQIKGEIQRMERLTRDLLLLARSDRGVLHLAVGRLSLGALAEDLADRVRLLADARGVAIQVQVERNVVVDGDPDRLEQVGLILLDNALEHTPSGGQVVIRVSRAGASAMLEVVDTGEGIPPDHLEHVFDRFYRADRARSRATGGVGLGLSIAQDLIVAHGGKLTIASQAGAGTHARVYLPLVERADLADSLVPR
jgi:two-component system sensor histidine kinase CiaH